MFLIAKNFRQFSLTPPFGQVCPGDTNISCQTDTKLNLLKTWLPSQNANTARIKDIFTTNKQNFD